MPKLDGTQLYQDSLESIPVAIYEHEPSSFQLVLAFIAIAIATAELNIDQGVAATGISLSLLAGSILADYKTSKSFEKHSADLKKQGIKIPLKESNPLALGLSPKRIAQLLLLYSASALYPPVGLTGTILFSLAALNNRRKNMRLEFIKEQLTGARQ